MMQKTILITGTAGFIGFHLARRLLAAGHRVIGIDAMTNYYDVRLKERRHSILEADTKFTPIIANIADAAHLNRIFANYKPEIVVHLAAQAGVRYSIDAPASYVESNLVGGFNILEVARQYQPAHLLFASTSSVYGANTKMPYAEDDPTPHQMSFYAATKKSNEVMAHSYAHLYGVPTTMFRFFTVYGPWGRPDMAIFKFTRAITQGTPIDVYNHGDLSRDFTYVDDITRGIELLIDLPPAIGEESPVAPYRIVNIGNEAPIKLLDFIKTLERVIGREAQMNLLPMQPGDVYRTWADTKRLRELTGYRASTDLYTGVSAFYDWYRHHYNEG